MNPLCAKMIRELAARRRARKKAARLEHMRYRSMIEEQKRKGQWRRHK